MYLATFFGMLCAIVSMAEMASMCVSPVLSESR